MIFLFVELYILYFYISVASLVYLIMMSYGVLLIDVLALRESFLCVAVNIILFDICIVICLFNSITNKQTLFKCPRKYRVRRTGIVNIKICFD